MKQRITENLFNFNKFIYPETAPKDHSKAFNKLCEMVTRYLT